MLAKRLAQNVTVRIERLDHRISKFVLQKNLLYEDVEGAPFRIGQKVRILDNPNHDDTFDGEFANRIGEVSFYEYNCGCGQTFPNDPMIGVRFADGKSEEFWKEELKSAS